ncbi:MAG: ferrochelatase [Coriobacteriales bacterium]|jgi:ferrochelatase
MADVKKLFGRQPDEEPPIGVVLVNFGMPERPTRKTVTEYLRMFLNDKRVSRRFEMVLYRILHRQEFEKAVDGITKRCNELEDDDFDYHETGARQKRMVAEELRKRGVENVSVTMAYRYATPTMHRALAHLAKIGCKKIIVMPLYPQSSYAFTSSVSDVLKRERIRFPRGAEFRFVESFHKNGAYVDAIAESIRTNPELEGRKPKFVFAYRAIPLRDVRKGDVYEIQTSASALAIARKLGLERKEWTIAYIPYVHLGKHSMLAPSINEVVDRFHIAKIHDIAVVCPGKLTDSLETLYDIDMVMRERFESYYEEKGDDYTFTYVPTLNDSPAFARLVAGILYKNMTGWIERTTPPTI